MLGADRIMNAQQSLAQSFWERPVAGSVITGIVAAVTAVLTAFFTYRSGQKSLGRQLDASRASLSLQLEASSRSLSRQLDASRDSWLRDHLLQEVSDYLAAARGLADQAFLVGATQVDILAGEGRPREAETIDPAHVARYTAALDSHAGLQRERDVLRERQHEFSGLVHGVRLLLAPNFAIAEELRATTDQFFGYSNKIQPDISDKTVHECSEKCKNLRGQLEEQVADLLNRSDLFAARNTEPSGTTS